jgi:hypothetical protein
MYAALWRILPGPAWVRVLVLVVLAAAILTVLVVWVFPMIDVLLEPQEVTVEQ